jgi:hypothetical protein
MNQSPVNETSPGDLLGNFTGRSLKSIILFTIVVHAVLVLATSGPYIWRSFFGEDSSKLSESERIDLAVKETQSAMRRIAEEHGLKPQDLGSRFATPAAARKAEPKEESKTEPKSESGSETKADPAATSPPAPEEPKSTIEKELKKAEPGPAVPADEDLFK